jgi:lysophospholipase L1-like esterase
MISRSRIWISGACVVFALIATSSARGEPASPTVKGVPRRSAWWRTRVDEINRSPGRGEARLIFIGDSITRGWLTVGQDVWEQRYGRRHALNLGVNGDRTGHVLWRLRNGNLDGLRPRAAVLLIGVNDSYIRDLPARRIAAGIAAIARELRARLPSTQILLLGILPCGRRPNAQRARIAETNRLISALDDGSRVHYLDIGQRFVTTDGTIRSTIMYDYLHPTERGYRILASAIEGKLRSLLGER